MQKNPENPPHCHIPLNSYSPKVFKNPPKRHGHFTIFKRLYVVRIGERVEKDKDNLFALQLVKNRFKKAKQRLYFLAALSFYHT
jgi:hypothetical protein